MPPPGPRTRARRQAQIIQEEQVEDRDVSGNDPIRTCPQVDPVILTAKSAFHYDPSHTYDSKVIFFGRMNYICKHCKARKFQTETPGMCCSGGKVKLPLIQTPPEPLLSLMDGKSTRSKTFLKYIRPYNSVFEMTSFGSENLIKGHQTTFKVQGQIYHRIGSLFPNTSKNEKHSFVQIYFMGDSQAELDRRCDVVSGLDKEIVRDIQNFLHEHNAVVKSFKTAIEQPHPEGNYRVVIHADRKVANVHRGRLNVPTNDEVAILMTADEEAGRRDIVIEARHADDQDQETEAARGASRPNLQIISETHRLYDALQYPIIHWKGQEGYSIDVPQATGTKTVSMKQYYAYMLMERENLRNHILECAQLTNKYVVDQEAKMTTERSNWLYAHQEEIRADDYQSVRDEMSKGTDPKDVGKKVILPATFVGSPRYMNEKIQDGMTYVRKYGPSSLFITMTCNPYWEEITRELRPGETPNDRMDIISRVFRLKLAALMHVIRVNQIFGEVICFMYTVEWQKRGLPHAHILIWLRDRIRLSDIDQIVSAELPDKSVDPELYELIKKHMVHGPCIGTEAGRIRPCYPQKAGQAKCDKGYPKSLTDATQTGKDGYPTYRRRVREPIPDDTIKIGKKVTGEEQESFTITNEWIVPYNPLLVKLFKCHINIELTHSIKSIKYICKYVNKGTDLAVMGLEDVKTLDEIKSYLLARYVSSSEAYWRIFGFPLHEHHPPVKQLAVHLENGQRVQIDTRRSLEDQMRRPKPTTLTAFFALASNDEFARTLLYNEAPMYYTLDERSKTWKRRSNGIDVEGWPGIKRAAALGRVYALHPANSECYHLRILLHTVKGPRSFDDLKTVDGEVCASFQQACLMRGLLEDDKQWENTLTETATVGSAHQVRNVFAILLAMCSVSDPVKLWENHKESMCEDLLYRARKDNPDSDLELSPRILNECLILIEDILLGLSEKTLKDFARLPQPNRVDSGLESDIIRETSHETDEDDIREKESKLLPEQKAAFDSICSAVEKQQGGIFFLDAPGGTGKTFLVNLILSKVRQSNKIALAVASSGIAATLLKGGKTAHATFKLPTKIVGKYVCNIPKQSARAKLLKQTALIVWDECTMTNRISLEAVDTTLRDIRNESAKIMGGITLVLAGDFRQTLPVIPKGSKADQLQACLHNSKLWGNVVTLRLTKNMRAEVWGDETAGEFANDLLQIGNGALARNQSTDLHSLPCGQIVENMDALIQNVFPDLDSNVSNHDWLFERAILAPKNAIVDDVNLLLLRKLSGVEKTYPSFDTVPDEDATKYPVEFLNSLNPPGTPPHLLILKEGAPIMMMRNLNPPRLCNGTRLAVKGLNPNIIEAVILSGVHKGEIAHIPRIPIIPSDIPFEFKRTQFPVRLSFAMSINKSQGQTLKVVGLHLEKSCFSHGQLYVGCSRVSSSSNLYVYTGPSFGTGLDTENVVYREALTSTTDDSELQDCLQSRGKKPKKTTAKVKPKSPLKAVLQRGKQLVREISSVSRNLFKSKRQQVEHSAGDTSTRVQTLPTNGRASTSGPFQPPVRASKSGAFQPTVQTSTPDSLPLRDDLLNATVFVNRPGTNDCWLNSVIRIIVHMMENVESPRHFDIPYLDVYGNGDQTDLLSNCFFRYIQTQIIDAKPSSLCFENQVIIVPGMASEWSLKQVLLQFLDFADFFENGGNDQQDVAPALSNLLSYGSDSVDFCRFYMTEKYVCAQCGRESETGDQGSLLCVYPPEHCDTFDLETSIRDSVGGINQPFERHCENTACTSERCHKTWGLLAAPTYLIVQLIIFGQDGQNRGYKLPQECSPVHDIDIVTHDGQHNQYKLECIIEHVGPSLNAGHYKSYRTNDGSNINNWVQYDDSKHTPVRLYQLPRQPYISVFRKQT